MFDKLFKSQDRQPVLATVILKSAPTEKVTQALETFGVKTDTVQEVEGVHILPQPDAGAGETLLIKLSEDIAVTVPTFKMDGEFAAMCAQRGFYPSVSIATDMLQEMLYKSMNKAKDGTDAAEMVAKSMDDAKAYMVQLVKGLPQSIFKMEKSEDLQTAFGEINFTREEAVKAEGEKAEDGQTTDTNDATSEGEEVKKADTPKEGEGNEGALDQEGVRSEVTGGIDMTALVAAVTKSVSDAVDSKFADINEKVDALGQRVEKAEKTSTAIDQSLRGTVFGGVSAIKDDDIEKSEDAREHVPLLDTGFARSR